MSNGEVRYEYTQGNWLHYDDQIQLTYFLTLPFKLSNTIIPKGLFDSREIHHGPFKDLPSQCQVKRHHLPAISECELIFHVKVGTIRGIYRSTQAPSTSASVGCCKDRHFPGASKRKRCNRRPKQVVCLVPVLGSTVVLYLWSYLLTMVWID